MTKSATAELYEADFVRWTEEQSAALREAARAGTNLPLDWENLAEEVDSLGISQRHELRSRIATILEHLMKLEHSPRADQRSGWISTIGQARLSIEAIFADSPSLRREVPAMIDWLEPRIARIATALRDFGEVSAALPPPSYTAEQILGDWFPEAPKPAPRPSPRARRVGASRGRA